MPNPIIPSADEAFDAWFHNFTMKFGTYAVALGYTTGFADTLTSEYEWFHWSLVAQGLFETELSERVALKRLLRDGPVGSPTPSAPSVPDPGVPEGSMPAPGIVPRLRKLIQAIKNNPAYTEAIGADLGIIAPASSESGTPKPDATATAEMNSQVKLRFKKGTHDAVIVEGQRGAETSWTQLDKVMRSPWTDTRAPLVAGQPEIRRYRLCYCDGDEAVGDFSDVLTVVTQP
jgi:hypothetical protein